MSNSHQRKKVSLKLQKLPSKEDKLFTAFENSLDEDSLYFPSERWALYATGYKEAADILVSTIETKEKLRDVLIYPIIFLYRQYLELAIKNLILQGRQLLDIEARFPDNHNIYNLWKSCIDLLNQIAPGDSEEELRQIERLLQEFYKVDPSATAFRYPVDKKGEPSLSSSFEIDPRNIKNVLAKISVILNGADMMMANCREIKADLSFDIY